MKPLSSRTEGSTRNAREAYPSQKRCDMGKGGAATGGLRGSTHKSPLSKGRHPLDLKEFHRKRSVTHGTGSFNDNG